MCCAGMIDQLVASRGDTFTGAYYSTFTVRPTDCFDWSLALFFLLRSPCLSKGFINRMRGYHAQNRRGDGWDQGAINSFYYTPARLAVKRTVMHKYKSVGDGFWPQEFHVAWRDIDHDLDQAQVSSTS
jgi:hypothetical protein